MQAGWLDCRPKETAVNPFTWNHQQQLQSFHKHDATSDHHMTQKHKACCFKMPSNPQIAERKPINQTIVGVFLRNVSSLLAGTLPILHLVCEQSVCLCFDSCTHQGQLAVNGAYKNKSVNTVRQELHLQFMRFCNTKHIKRKLICCIQSKCTIDLLPMTNAP